MFYLIFVNNKMTSNEKFGDQKEKLIYPYLQGMYPGIEKQEYKYAPIDFIRELDGMEKIAIELKGRRNAYNRYPTTLITLHKIVQGDILFRKGFTVKYFFMFTDGVYCYDHTVDSLELPQTGIRGVPHCLININELTHVCDISDLK